MFGTINIVGGFLVTDRMLEMFKQRQPDEDGQAVSRTWIELAYPRGRDLLIVGIKRLSHPRTARSSNWIASAG